jgi:hypothetical protein
VPTDSYVHTFAVRIRIEVLPAEGPLAWHGYVENLVTRDRTKVRSVDDIADHFDAFLRRLGFEDRAG